MRSQGFQSARIVTVHREFDAKDRVKLVIYLFEGVQTRVRRVDISGAEINSPEEVRRQLGIREGQPFDPYALARVGVEVRCA
jgi:outer membrane protein assembly factor BamA